MRNDAFAIVLHGKYTRDPFYLHGLTLIPVWISNHTPRGVWDGITYPFPNGGTVEVSEWISNFIHTL